MGVPFCGSRGLVAEGQRHKSPDLALLAGPSGSRPISNAGRGRGQSSEEGVAGRGELCGQGTTHRAQLRSAVSVCDPWLSAPQSLPKMIPAVVLLLLLLVEQAAALGEPQLCYILDAILFLYGIVLTLLYCRLKLQVRKAAIDSYEKSDGVYTGLSTRNQETYETLKHEKPPQ